MVAIPSQERTPSGRRGLLPGLGRQATFDGSDGDGHGRADLASARLPACDRVARHSEFLRELCLRQFQPEPCPSKLSSLHAQAGYRWLHKGSSTKFEQHTGAAPAGRGMAWRLDVRPPHFEGGRPEPPARAEVRRVVRPFEALRNSVSSSARARGVALSMTLRISFSPRQAFVTTRGTAWPRAEIAWRWNRSTNGSKRKTRLRRCPVVSRSAPAAASSSMV